MNFVARVRVGLADNHTQLLADCPSFDRHKVRESPTCSCASFVVHVHVACYHACVMGVCGVCVRMHVRVVCASLWHTARTRVCV